LYDWCCMVIILQLLYYYYCIIIFGLLFLYYYYHIIVMESLLYYYYWIINSVVYSIIFVQLDLDFFLGLVTYLLLYCELVLQYFFVLVLVRLRDIPFVLVLCKFYTTSASYRHKKLVVEFSEAPVVWFSIGSTRYTTKRWINMTIYMGLTVTF
jgi:hypothetical protein